MLPTLVIMLKAPMSGAAKTRLARCIGAGEALRFYRAATAALLRRVARDPRWRTVLAISPDHLAMAPFWPRSLARLPQGRGGLGMRMQRLLDLPVPGPLAIIGSDIPDVRASHVAEAFRLAARYGLVFGPAADGGFWLVGARRRPKTPRPFANVRWSSPHALADTRANIRTAVGYCAVLSDVDTAADWRRWRRTGSAMPDQTGGHAGGERP